MPKISNNFERAKLVYPNYSIIAVFFKKHARKAIIAICILLVISIFGCAANWIVNRQDCENNDFFIYWLGGRMWDKGQNPYISELWISNHSKYGAEFITDPIFPYPLPLAFLFTPLGWLPIKSAYILWVFLSEIFVVVAIHLLLSLWNNPIRKHYYFPLIAGAFLFRPVIAGFNNGQLAAFLLLLLSLAILLWKRGFFWQSEALLILIALKTNIGIFIMILFCIWLLFRKRLLDIIRLAFFGMLIILIGMTLDPKWLITLLNIGSEKLKRTFGYSPTVWGIAGTICLHQSPCTLLWGSFLTLIILLILIYILFKNINAISLTLSLIVSGVLLVTPYVWAYDQTLLIIAIMVVTVYLREQGGSFLSTAIFPIAIALVAGLIVMISLRLGNDSMSALIPLICFILTLYCVNWAGKAQPIDGLTDPIY